MKILPIELDITYKCNLTCANCTRKCDLLSGRGTDISIAQVIQFIEENTLAKSIYKTIFLMGGEPTLHLKLKEIISLLSDYIKNSQAQTNLCVVSNCHSEETQALLIELKDKVSIRYAYKDRKTKQGGSPDRFWTMNVAPIDLPEFEGIDFSQGCKQRGRCGLQYTADGKYFTCSMAGGIDRFFNFNVGASLKEIQLPEIQRLQMQKLCAFCGRFRLKYEPKVSGSAHEINFEDPQREQLYLKHINAEYPLRSKNRVLSDSYFKGLQEIKQSEVA
jgi:hypothetical protein